MLLDDISHVLTSKSGIVAAVLVLLFFLERMFPYISRATNWVRVMRNVMLSVLNFVAGPLIVIPLTALATSYALEWRPEAWSGWWGLLADVVLLDLWIYAWHRANHVLPFLWRFHEVHHLDEALDTTSALRFHFGEVVLSSCVRAGVVWCLAVPLSSVVVFEVLVLSSALFHHSNLRLPARFEHVLSYLIVTPSVHWVHHHAVRIDTDSNYCTIFSIWDFLFNSRSQTRRKTNMPIGVEQKSELPLLGLIGKPFRD